MIRFAIGFCGLIALATVSYAQPGDAGQVTAVRVAGLERVSEQLVRSQLEVQAGQPYEPRAVSRDIRRLYELGFFTRIRAEAEPYAGGLEITYVLEEKRVIDEVVIIGNDRLRDRRVRGVLSWREGDSFIADGYDQEREAILDLYAERGFANTSVDIIAEEIGPSRVRITYQINEGQKARIRDINFVGNEVLSDRQLRRLIQTKRAWWFLGGRYDERRFEADLNVIIEEYADYGRLEAEIPRADLTFTETGKGMNITVYIEEGPEYRIDTLEVAGNEVYDQDEVLGLVELRAGDTHNKSQVTEDAEIVQKGYRDSGYVDASVTPQVILDRENKTTQVVHNIDEQEVQYIRQVKVTGNEVTKDEVIRRNLLLQPGERFDGGRLELSRRGLDNLGYFDATRVSLDDVPGQPLYSDLLVNVEEGDTGNFNFGAGYNTEEGIGGFAELQLNNFDPANWPSFSGGGQRFEARLDIGDTRNSYALGWTNPEFLGYPLSAGIDLFNESYRVRGGADYEERQTGVQVRFNKRISPFLSSGWGARYADVEVTDLPLSFLLNPRLRSLGEDGTTVAVSWNIVRDSRDRRFDTSTGSRHEIETTLAGLGGDFNWWRVQHDSQWFRPLDEDRNFILSFRTREGLVLPYGDSKDVPLNARLYAGGTTTVRGFDQRDIGPTVREGLFFGEDFRIGGEMRLVQNAELKYKYRDLVRLYGFVDGGGVWEEPGDFGLDGYKVSVGIGFGVDVPQLGPMRVDYGIPLNADEDQSSGRLHLTTGFRF